MYGPLLDQTLLQQFMGKDEVYLLELLKMQMDCHERGLLDDVLCRWAYTELRELGYRKDPVWPYPDLYLLRESRAFLQENYPHLFIFPGLYYGSKHVVDESLIPV